MADIGEKLRSAREAKGLSIADIEKASKIQSRYLTAIEQNDFDKLPGEFYVRAFIRQYAQLVGLDGKDLLSDFHKEVPETKPDEYVENSIDNKSEEVKQTTNNKKGLWKSYLPKIAIGLGIAIVVLIAYVVYARLFSGSGNTDNQNAGVSVSEQSSSNKKAKPVVKTSSVKIKPLTNGQYRVTGLKQDRNLVVRAGNQSVTATVQIDGNTSWSQSLSANQKRTTVIPKGTKSVVVTLSNDEGSKVTIGGKRVPYNANGASRTITLLLGKKQKTTANSSTNNSQTTTNQTTNSSNTTTNGNNSVRSSSTKKNATTNANSGNSSNANNSSNTPANSNANKSTNSNNR